MNDLTAILKHLDRTALIEVITEAAEAHPACGQLLAASAAYAAMTPAEQQALHERFAEESTDGMEVWTRAVEDWEDWEVSDDRSN